MSLIVVEGPDGSGKSTLIQSLRSHTQRYYATWRLSGPPAHPEPFKQALYLLNQFACALDLKVVADRHPIISESIYGRLCRSFSFLSNMTGLPEQILRWDRLIYCRPPLFSIMEGIQKEKQMEGVIDNLHQIIDAYDTLIDHFRTEFPRLRIIHYDWTGHIEPLPDSIDDLFFG